MIVVVVPMMMLVIYDDHDGGNNRGDDSIWWLIIIGKVKKTQRGRIKYKGGTKPFNPILILSKKVS